jgi:PAS domain-containing protein
VLSLILRLEPLEPSQPSDPTQPSLEPPSVVRLPDVLGDESGSADLETAAPDVEHAAAPSVVEIPLVPAALVDDVPSVNGNGPVPHQPTARQAPPPPPLRPTGGSPLASWSAAVAAAHDACFILDVSGVLVSISGPAIDLLGSGSLSLIGRHILEVVNLVDLDTGASNPEYQSRITPLSVLESPGLARSLIRVRHEGGAVVTLDTSSTPVHDCTGELLGSMTFISPIPTR